MKRTRRWRTSSESERRSERLVSSPAQSTRSQARGRHDLRVSPKRHPKKNKKIPEHLLKSPPKQVSRKLNDHDISDASDEVFDNSDDSSAGKDQNQKPSAKKKLKMRSTDDETSKGLLLMHHGQKLTKMSVRYQHDKCVKEHLFPKVKFIASPSDLHFSNNQNSICRFMAERLMIEEDNIEMWWGSAATTTHISLKTHRNNVIKNIKKCFFGKRQT